jgi:ferritin-like metal-binding protein YciE
MNPRKTERHELLLQQLGELFFLENQLVGGLAYLAECAAYPRLKNQLLEHLAETKDHVKRLELAFALLQETPKAYPSQMVTGMMDDMRWLVHVRPKGPALDLALCTAVRGTEAYEAALYRNLVHTAKACGKGQVAALCSSTLEEERAAEDAMVAMMFLLGDDDSTDSSLPRAKKTHTKDSADIHQRR